MAVAALGSSAMAASLQVDARDLGLLFVFGALNLGLGMAFFVSGGPKIPASFVALLGTLETVLGPVWVWLAHGELPDVRTLLGGAIVFGALLAHLLWQFSRRGSDETPRPE
jgi:drug/metabolite transporter (DMT)-like permease